MLTCLGFGPRCVGMVNTLFSCASAFFSVNNSLYPHILLHWSIRQGCPLAPHLYVLTADALGYLLEAAHMQRQLRGVSLPDDKELTRQKPSLNTQNTTKKLETQDFVTYYKEKYAVERKTKFPCRMLKAIPYGDDKKTFEISYRNGNILCACTCCQLAIKLTPYNFDCTNLIRPEMEKRLREYGFG
nr:hypothetical protein Q903MT_gene2384 [Picea sitchensis]